MFFVPDIPATPRVWHVCFAKTSEEHWFDRFMPAGFRHVFLLGYLPEYRLWLWFDPQKARNEIALISPALAGRLLTLAVDQGNVLAFNVSMESVSPPRFWHRLGYWCVPAVARVLGLRCVAVTPWQLHDFLLQHGAKPLLEESDEPVRRAESPAGRPGSSGGPAIATAPG